MVRNGRMRFNDNITNIEQQSNETKKSQNTPAVSDMLSVVNECHVAKKWEEGNVDL